MQISCNLKGGVSVSFLRGLDQTHRPEAGRLPLLEGQGISRRVAFNRGCRRRVRQKISGSLGGNRLGLIGLSDLDRRIQISSRAEGDSDSGPLPVADKIRASILVLNAARSEEHTSE